MKKLTVSNPKLQAKLDKINGWREVFLVAIVVAFTAFMIWITL